MPPTDLHWSCYYCVSHNTHPQPPSHLTPPRHPDPQPPSPTPVRPSYVVQTSVRLVPIHTLHTPCPQLTPYPHLIISNKLTHSNPLNGLARQEHSSDSKSCVVLLITCIGFPAMNELLSWYRRGDVQTTFTSPNQYPGINPTQHQHQRHSHTHAHTHYSPQVIISHTSPLPNFMPRV